MFENENNELMDFIKSVFSDQAKCRAIIDLIKQEKLEIDSFGDGGYAFANMAFIIQKVYDDDADAIHSFVDFINDNVDHVLNLVEERKNNV